MQSHRLSLCKEPTGNNGTNRFLESVRKTLRHVEGTYGIASSASIIPLKWSLPARPLRSSSVWAMVNISIASDASALISRTQNVVLLEGRRNRPPYAVIFSITTLDQADVSPVVDKITWSIADARERRLRALHGEGDFRAAARARKYECGPFSEDGSTAQFGGLNITAAELRQIDRFLFLRLRYRPGTRAS